MMNPLPAFGEAKASESTVLQYSVIGASDYSLVSLAASEGLFKEAKSKIFICQWLK